MEIRNVTETPKKEYPKMNQITEKKLRDTIPNKWLKVGLSSLMIAILMKNNAFATSSLPDYTMELAGETQLIVDTPLYVQICPAVQVVSIIVFIISGIAILKTKSKAKKQNETKKVKKWIKAIFIISILLFILSTSIRILYPLFEMV